MAWAMFRPHPRRWNSIPRREAGADAVIHLTDCAKRAVYPLHFTRQSMGESA